MRKLQHCGTVGAGSLLLTMACLCAARAELQICNQSLDILNVAIGYEDRGEFQTEGWWSIGANRCSEVIRVPLANRFYYIYAEDVFGQPVISGDVPACIDARRFTLRGTQDCWIRGARQAGFSEIDTQSQERWTVFLAAQD
ncbi:MAG: DUF1036 domain-containing protein [Rhizobiaceae bacterium]|jgi:uncharacterized membrane protein|nr:DUF1036 domain-containing protein [Rhizobiaceae bacterium]